MPIIIFAINIITIIIIFFIIIIAVIIIVITFINIITFIILIIVIIISINHDNYGWVFHTQDDVKPWCGSLVSSVLHAVLLPPLAILVRRRERQCISLPASSMRSHENALKT